MSDNVKSEESPSTSATDVRGGTRAWYALGVLVLAVLFGFIDRQIIVLVVEPMKQDIGISDSQIGAIQGLGPALFAVIMGYPLAWLADRVNRSWLLAACILFWSAATAARGYSQSFSDLMLYSTGIAVGEAVLTPIIYSLIPDLFAGKRREFANFVFFGATVIGVGIGLMLGGAALGATDALRPFLPESLASLAGWRLACLLVAAPGIAVALLALTIPSSRKSQPAQISHGAKGVSAPILPYLRAHWRPLSAIFTAMGLYAFAYAVIGTWLPVAIIRDLGVPAAEVGLRFGTTFTIAAILGVILAMVSAPLWRRMAGRAHVFRAIATCTGFAALAVLALLIAKSPMQAYLAAGAAFALLTTGAAYSPTLYQNIAPPLLRARVAAIVMVFYAVFGASGPLAAGLLSDAVGAGPGKLMVVIVWLTAPAFAVSALAYRLLEQPYIRMSAAIDESVGAAAFSGEIEASPKVID